MTEQFELVTNAQESVFKTNATAIKIKCSKNFPRRYSVEITYTSLEWNKAKITPHIPLKTALSKGSFENEALESEDWSTKHRNLENEAPKSRKRTSASFSKLPLSKSENHSTNDAFWLVESRTHTACSRVAIKSRKYKCTLIGVISHSLQVWSFDMSRWLAIIVWNL